MASSWGGAASYQMVEVQWLISPEMLVEIEADAVVEVATY